MLKVKALIALGLFLIFSFVIIGCETIYSVIQEPEATETAEEGKLPEWLLSEHRQFELTQVERDEEPLKPKDPEEGDTVETPPAREETVAEQEPGTETHTSEGSAEEEEGKEDTGLTSAREILAGQGRSDKGELTESQKRLAEGWTDDKKDSDNNEDNDNGTDWWKP